VAGNLGEIKMNWRTLSMSFVHQGKNLLVQGDPNLSKVVITLRTLQKLSNEEVEMMTML